MDTKELSKYLKFWFIVDLMYKEVNQKLPRELNFVLTELRKIPEINFYLTSHINLELGNDNTVITRKSYQYFYSYFNRQVDLSKLFIAIHTEFINAFSQLQIIYKPLIINNLKLLTI